MAVLAGVRVLDFGRYVAGPYCATLLGYLGAEVIRIEKRDGGEDRYIAPIADVRRGQRVLPDRVQQEVTDARPGHTRRAVKSCGDWCARADVVVANLPPSGSRIARARLREPQGDSARHHPGNAVVVRRRRPARRARRLRWRRTSDVRRDAHDRHARASSQVRRAVRRLFDGRAIRVRHARGADAARADRRRPGGEDEPARHGDGRLRLAPHRTERARRSTVCRPATGCRRPHRPTCSRLATATSSRTRSAMACSAAGRG